MNAFEIVVYAIVAVAIIAVLAFLFAPYFTPAPISDTIKKNLDRAQSSLYLGETISLGLNNILADTLLQKGTFEASNISFAFECNDPKICCEMTQSTPQTNCNLPVEWSYKTIKFKSTQKTLVSIRCIKVDDYPVCRTYFGQLPAQAKIESIKIESKQGSKIAILTTIGNEGKSNSIPLTTTMQLEKMVNSTWSDTGEEFTSKETTVLTPGQKQELLWDLEILTSGKYRAVFRAEGTNSGFDQNSLEFDVGENDLCKTDETTPTDTRLAADGNYLETHYCTGCTYAYECATAWINKNPSIVYEPNTSSDTYCVKKSYNGAC